MYILNKPLPYNPTYVQLFVFCSVGTYVRLYESGLFNVALYVNLLCHYHTTFWVLTSLHFH